MSEKKSNYLWFLNELPGLRSENVISEEAADALRKYYQNRLESVPNRQKILQTVMVSFSGVLICAGIILFFNYNWDFFPKTVRIGISFLPLLAGAALTLYTLTAHAGKAWREMSAVITFAGICVVNALLSQIYQINGSLHDYMVLVLSLSLPLVYIMDSSALCLLYGICLPFLAPKPGIPGNVLISLTLVCAVMPYIFLHLLKDAKTGKYTSALTLVLCMIPLQWLGDDAAQFTVAFIAVFLMIAARFQKSLEHAKREYLVLMLPGGIAMLLMLSASTFHAVRFRIYGGAYSEYSFLVVACLLAAGIAAFLYCSVKQKKADIWQAAAAIFLVHTCCIMWFRYYPQKIMSNAVMAGIGMLMMYNGYKKMSSAVYYNGIVIIAVLAAMRFFDNHFPVLFRAAGFVFIGVLFLIANILYRKRLRKNSTSAAKTEEA